MALSFRPLHPTFAAEVSAVDLRRVHDDETLAQIRTGMDEYAVLVFPDQAFDDAQHIAFAQRLDGELHTRTGSRALGKSRLGNEALGDISNLAPDGEIMGADDRRRMYGLGNRLWHTDASFQDPAGRYSMLFAYVVPPVGADTEFADTRAAYDALTPEMKARLEGLRVHTRSPIRGRFWASSSPRTSWARSRARSIPSSAPFPAPIDARSTWRRTPRASSTGPCPRGVCSYTS